MLAKFGNSSQSCESLFRSSSKEGTRGVVLASFIERVYQKPILKIKGFSEVVCRPCGRKIRTLIAYYESIKSAVEQDGNNECEAGFSKRKSSEVITPTTGSPLNRKAKRTKSPAKSRKTLEFTVEEHENLSVASAQNIDHLNIVPNVSSDLKVVIAYPNGNVVVKNNLDSDP